MVIKVGMATILYLFTFWICTSAACQIDDGAALYNIKLQFLQDNGFDTSKFQWTIIFGESHNSSYALYREGEAAGPLIRNFIKSGVVEGLLEAANEEPKVYDQFRGAADEDIMALVNGRHSLISFISPMKTSPHWFVGVDSLPLCVNDFWIDQITLELELMELAAFGEFSKDYPGIVKINSESFKDMMHHQATKHVPSHIAKAEFKKVKEYSTVELNNLAHKELVSELKTGNLKEHPRTKYDYEDTDSHGEINAKNDLDTLKDLEEEPFGTPKPGLPDNNVIVVTKSPVFGRRRVFDDSQNNFRSMDDAVLAVATGYKLGLGKHLPRHFRSRLHHAVNRHLDCKVGEWSEWSDCTEPCGGQTVRMRTIVQQREGEGRGCPHLIESKACDHLCRGDHEYEP